MLPESRFKKKKDFRCDFICAFICINLNGWVWLGLMLQTCSMPLCVCVYMNSAHNAMRVRIGQILTERSRVEFITILKGKVRVFVPSAVMAFSKGCPSAACDCGMHYDKQVGTNLIKFWPWLCFFVLCFSMFSGTCFLFYYNTDVCVHINILANGDASLSALFSVQLLYLYSEPLGVTKLIP